MTSVTRSLLAALGAAALLAVAVPAPAGAEELPASFPVAGSGYGHAVGMSQWGAYGMAKAGFAAPAIVTYYYPGTTVASVQDDMDIAVNLLYQVASTRMRAEALDPTGGGIEVTVGPTVVVGTPADEFRFAVAGAGVSVQRITNGQVADLGSAGSVTVRWAGTRAPGAAPGGPTLLNVVGPGGALDSPGHRYRFGTVTVAPVSTGAGVRLNVVNAVRIHDEYLFGISEVSSSWPDAAQQAQVLAARTYAMSKVGRGLRTACGCHVDDGGGPYADQTFTGWTKASSARGDRWVANVNATATGPTTGLAILFGGVPISAFYSASSGGATQSSKDVWGGNLPYAVSVPDPWMLHEDNPERAWTKTVTQAAMAAVFGLPAVLRVDVVERFVSGAVKRVAATAPDGTVVTRTGNQFQGALRLKSSFVTAIAGNPGVALPALPPATPPAAPAPPAAPVAPVAPAPPAAGVVQRRVSLLTPTAVTASPGGRYKVVGVVRPAKAGLKTWRQVLVNGEWRTVDKARTNKKGKYRFVIRDAGPRGTATYRVLVVKKKAVVGVSAEFTVTVQ